MRNIRKTGDVLTGLVVLISVLLPLLFYGFLGYVIFHFATKYW